MYSVCLAYLRQNLWICFIDTFLLDDLQDINFGFTVVLSRQDSKTVLSCSFKKSARYDCQVSDLYYKYVRTISAQ